MKQVAVVLSILLVIVLALGSTHNTAKRMEVKQPPRQLSRGWAGDAPIMAKSTGCAPVMHRADNLTLTVGKAWETEPCTVPNHTGSFQRVIKGATIKLLAGYPKSSNPRGDLVYIYLLPDGKYQVAAHNPDYLECGNCTFNRTLETQPLFPSGAVPLAVWAVTFKSGSAQWEETGFPVFDQYVLELGEGIALAVETLPGKYLLQLDGASAPYRVVSPPAKSGDACDPGSVATDSRYSYRCAHIRELYVRDGQHYRWIRTPMESGW